MLYYSTKSLLRSILQSLETAEEAVWDDHIESGKECLYEMFQMTGPGATAMSDTEASRKLGRAIPHMKLMLRAIREKNQITAMAHGRAALAEM
jgi:hypothetical protein